MPRIHEFTIPGPGSPTLEIIELTVTRYNSIAKQAAKDHPLDLVGGTVLEANLKRLACIRGYGKKHVSQGDKPHDILAEMSCRAQGFLDAAIDHVHDVRAEEIKPFFGTQKTTEV